MPSNSDSNRITVSQLSWWILTGAVALVIALTANWGSSMAKQLEDHQAKIESMQSMIATNTQRYIDIQAQLEEVKHKLDLLIEKTNHLK